MSEPVRLACSYKPLPPQQAFRLSKADIRAYGGAMGGGKSRALCEEAFDLALSYPGIMLPVFRQKHTAIIGTTRKTFFEQVLPVELREHCKVKFSGGEDYVQLWNGSQIHFVGLDDPIKWFSSELGAIMFDEAHEIAENDVITLMSRLRQRCQVCVRGAQRDCEHLPHTTYLAFNPAHPDHWLQRWFIQGSTRTEFGFYKPELFTSDDAIESSGAAEFVIAKATDNPHLPSDYVTKRLGSMPAPMRRRYLEGLWEHISGHGFFDAEALSEYARQIMDSPMPKCVGVTDGDLSGLVRNNRIRVRPRENGPLQVFELPVGRHWDEEADREVKPHRYIVAVDVSSGGSTDKSAIQVIDIEDFAQVAEWNGKLDPDLVAVEAFRLACIYNGALIAPEVTGGWGMTIVKRAQDLLVAYRGASKPRLYTRPIFDRLSQKWTDRLGWDTTAKTRAHMLDTLERVIREQEFVLRGHRSLSELGTFAYPEKKEGAAEYSSPRAQSGANDDLVIALAIGVTLATHLPRQLRRPPQNEHVPVISGVTGY